MLPAFPVLWSEIATGNNSLGHGEHCRDAAKATPSESGRDEKQCSPKQEWQAELKQGADDESGGREETEASNASVRISRAALLEIQSLPQDCKSDGTALSALKGDIAARPVALLAAIPLNIPDTAMRVAITKRIVKARNPPRTRRIRFGKERRSRISGMMHLGGLVRPCLDQAE